jgi:hypothetical protein
MRQFEIQHTTTRGLRMITNANRSGSVRDESGKDRREKPQDEVRSGRSSDRPEVVKRQKFKLRRQKIKEISGELMLVDA